MVVNMQSAGISSRFVFMSMRSGCSMHRVPHGAGASLVPSRDTRAEAATSFTIVRCRWGQDQGGASSYRTI